MFSVWHAFLSVHCSLVVICWERAGLLALLYVMFYCVFVTFPCCAVGQVWYLIVSIPDHCILILKTGFVLTNSVHFIWVFTVLGFRSLNGLL